MYFDHCQQPADLREAISEFMMIQTGRRVDLGGKLSVTIPLIDERTDQTLREGYAEAQAAAKRIQKENLGLPEVPSTSVVPLERLLMLSDWCEKAEAMKRPARPWPKEIHEYAVRVADLCDGLEIPHLEAGAPADVVGDTLRQIRAVWLENAESTLERNWPPTRRIFEVCNPGKLQTLNEMRQGILDVMKEPPTGHLEPRGGKLIPDDILLPRIRRFSDELLYEAQEAAQSPSVTTDWQTAFRAAPEQALKVYGEAYTKTFLTELQKRREGLRLSLPKIPGLIERLKALRSVLGSGDPELVNRARDDLMAYAGSAEQLYELLKDQPRALSQLQCVYDAQERQQEARLYPAFFDGLATDEIIGELEQCQAQGKQPPAGATKSMRERFTFNPGQVLFDGEDLELPSGEPITVLKVLVDHFNHVVQYRTLDQHYSSVTPGTLPKMVTKIRGSFDKHNVPCEIIAKTGEGYLMRQSRSTTKRNKRVRKRS